MVFPAQTARTQKPAVWLGSFSAPRNKIELIELFIKKGTKRNFLVDKSFCTCYYEFMDFERKFKIYATT